MNKLLPADWRTRGGELTSPASRECEDVEYHVFRDGRAEGPFTEAQVVAFLEAGKYSLRDLGQTSGQRHWVPLQTLFNVEEVPAEAQSTAHKIAHYRRALGNVAAQVRAMFTRYPLETGLLCLAVGSVVVMLSYAPVLIFGPWLAGALAAGAILMMRGRALPGLLLCAAAVFLPIALWRLVKFVAERF